MIIFYEEIYEEMLKLRLEINCSQENHKLKSNWTKMPKINKIDELNRMLT